MTETTEFWQTLHDKWLAKKIMQAYEKEFKAAQEPRSNVFTHLRKPLLYSAAALLTCGVIVGLCALIGVHWVIGLYTAFHVLLGLLIAVFPGAEWVTGYLKDVAEAVRNELQPVCIPSRSVLTTHFRFYSSVAVFLPLFAFISMIAMCAAFGFSGSTVILMGLAMGAAVFFTILGVMLLSVYVEDHARAHGIELVSEDIEE